MIASNAIAALEQAALFPDEVAARARTRGQRVVWTLGCDIPRALVAAFGYLPVRLVPGEADAPSAIDDLIRSENLSRRGRWLLARIAALPAQDALLISHADCEQPQIFATLRELARCGAIPPPNVAFLDLLTSNKPATLAYNRIRVTQTLDWLETLGGVAGQDALRGAIERENRLRSSLGKALALRSERRMNGATAHRLIAASAILPDDEAIALLSLIVTLPEQDGTPVMLGGSLIENCEIVAAIESDGPLVIGEDHAWGENRARPLLDGNCDPVDAFAASAIAPVSGPFCSVADRATKLTARAVALGVGHVIHLTLDADEASPWQAGVMRRAVEATGIAFEVRPAAKPVEPELPRPAGAPKPRRSRKSLAAVAEFSSYQRDWFAGLRRTALEGAPLIAVNANAPQETMRAMAVPFVVNQWWASIVAAKQQTARYGKLLADHDLPGNVEAYSAQGVAAAFDHDEVLAPWGGLPKPSIVGAVLSTDATSSIFQAWAAAAEAQLQTFERSVESRWDIPVDWWDGLAERWDEFIEPERLDLMEAELLGSIAALETLTGRAFDPAAFEQVMNLVNEQEDFYRQTRDLVAQTVPVPVGIVDTMPATMVPQWHRGTAWARDAARLFRDEVAARVAAGEGACPNERLRLMFVGRGLWSDMSFYQRWEESHGAVFVCSMYLSLAADGYIRRHDRGRDPMRALAARFVTMGDELRMPTWAGAWHVKEAALHQVDGAVALSDADPLVLRALREAGVAVLELGIDNFALDDGALVEVDRLMAGFLDGPAAAAAARRLQPGANGTS